CRKVFLGRTAAWPGTANLTERHLLQKVGLLETTQQGYSCPVMMCEEVVRTGKLIFTDYPHRSSRNMVFPLHPESLYLAANSTVTCNDRVLDLCTGSGIIAISCADQASQVTAVDINDRA